MAGDGEGAFGVVGCGRGGGLRGALCGGSVEVAPALLGWWLVRSLVVDGACVEVRGRIVEVEAYAGVEDRASHSFGGRRTARVASMYGRAGTCYVYFTYGMHHCMNVVVSGEGVPEAVLIRALEPSAGSEEVMRRLRASASGREAGALRMRDLCSGPAKLCQSMGIDRSLDGVDLVDGRGGVWLERGALRGAVRVGTRVGLGRGAGAWAGRPWRWWEGGNGHVSRGG